MSKLNRINLYIFLSTVFTSITAGQGIGGSELPGGVVINFVDDIVVSQVSTWNDLVLYVLIPLIGIYAILHFLFHHAFKLAEGNFNDNTGYGSSSMSDVGKQASKWVAAAAAVLTTMFYGGFTGVVILIIGFSAIIWFIWKVWKAIAATGGGFNIPNPFGGNGGGGDTPDVDYPDSIPVDAPDSISIDRPPWLDELTGGGDGGGGGHPIVNMMQQQMQQQQMQITPAMLQLMGFMYGMARMDGDQLEVRPVNGDGPSAEVNVDVAQELNNVLQNLNQNMINQELVNDIMNMMQQQQQMNNQNVQQMIAFLREWEQNPQRAAQEFNIEGDVNMGGGSGGEGVNVDVDVDVKNVINQVQQNQVVQNFYQQVQQAQFLNAGLKEQLLALLTGDIHQESQNVYYIQVPDGATVEIRRDVMIRFYQLLMSLRMQQIEALMSRLEQLLQRIGRQQQLTNDLLEELIAILQDIESGGEEGDTAPVPEPEGPTLNDQLIEDIEELIQKLGKEESMGEEVYREKRDAEQKLADALKKLMDHEGVFRALIYFRKVNMDAPQADIHQQVEKIMRNINQIGSPSHLQREVDTAEKIVVEIEKALQEVRDADEKMASEMNFEQSSEADLEEISRIVNELQNGETKVRQYLNKYEDL